MEKTAGGATTEVAVSPAGAELDDFVWRVSLASVEGDGSFSIFPGMDRVLTIVEGVLVLEVFDAPPVTLDAASAPHAFPGDVATFGRALGGAVVDINVMSRRGCCIAKVTQFEVGVALEVAPKGDDNLLIVLEGAFEFQGADEQARLGVRDAWRGRGGVWKLTPAPSARALLVEFESSSGAR